MLWPFRWGHGHPIRFACELCTATQDTAQGVPLPISSIQADGSFSITERDHTASITTPGSYGFMVSRPYALHRRIISAISSRLSMPQLAEGPVRIHTLRRRCVLSRQAYTSVGALNDASGLQLIIQFLAQTGLFLQRRPRRRSWPPFESTVEKLRVGNPPASFIY